MFAEPHLNVRSFIQGHQQWTGRIKSGGHSGRKFLVTFFNSLVEPVWFLSVETSQCILSKAGWSEPLIQWRLTHHELIETPCHLNIHFSVARNYLTAFNLHQTAILACQKHENLKWFMISIQFQSQLSYFKFRLIWIRENDWQNELSFFVSCWHLSK